ncbi:MAG: VgrG-related protein [Chloroflexi bacterium]|nr:VgrG-related protein [Chloroflexota bacterium]
MVAPARMLTSAVHIKINGSYLADEQMRRISEVVVEQSLHLPDMAVLRLHDVGDDTNPGRTVYFKTVDRGPFDIGSTLEIAMGREERPTTVFKGEITAIEIDVNLNHPPLITVRGYSRAHRLHRGRFCRSFLDEKDSAIVEKIARETGLRAETEETPEHKYVYQNNQTNWEFLKERAALNGFELFVEDRTLYFRAPKNGQSRGPEPRLWENLLSLRIKETSAWQVGQVIVRAWNPQDKQPIVGMASRGQLAPSTGIGKSGAQVAATFGNATVYVVNRPVASQDEANKLAQAVLDELDGSFIQAEGICLGDPAIKPGISLPLQTLGATFSGTYYVTTATHMINALEGYTTSFVVSGRQTNSLLELVQTGSGRDSVASVVIGIVTDNNDPDGQGRVKVKFPWLSADDNTSTWARVVSPMAGKERGIYFLPEVNDEVLVAFEHGDMARPFVIGALWNGQDAPPKPNSQVVSNSQVNQRIIKTRAGHIITLDDTAGAETISIVDKTGNNLIKIESASNKITIKANGDIAIDSQGTTSVTAHQNVTVEAQEEATVKARKDVNVQADGNASVQANGKLNLNASEVNVEAKGAMTLKTNGVLTIQGTEVRIN